MQFCNPSFSGEMTSEIDISQIAHQYSFLQRTYVGEISERYSRGAIPAFGDIGAKTLLSHLDIGQ